MTVPNAPTTLSCATDDAHPSAMPPSLAVVVGLYVLSALAGLYGLMSDGITIVGAVRALWSVGIVVLLLRGSEGARVFVRFSALLTAALGALVLLLSMMSGDSGVVPAIALVWLAIGGFTYWALASEAVQTWMATRLIERMDGVDSGAGTRR